MENFRNMRCHACNEVQRDRWAYRNHLLRVHGKVIRTGTTTPIRLEGRELETVWAADYNRLLGASRRREALGLPRVPDQKAARRLHENRARRACRARSVARADETARQRAARQRVARPTRAPVHVAPPTRVATPPPTTVAARPTVVTPTADRHSIQAGSLPAKLHDTTSARTSTPCGRCLNCPCRRPNDLRGATRLPAPTCLTPHLSPSRLTYSAYVSASIPRTPPAVA